MEKKLLGERGRNLPADRDQDIFLAGVLPGDSGKQAYGYGPSVTYRRIHFSKQEGFRLTTFEFFTDCPIPPPEENAGD